MENHTEFQDAKDSFSRFVDNLSEGQKWLGVVWTVSDDGKVKMSRTTWDFPLDALEECVDQIWSDIRKDVAEKSKVDPLPEADI